VARLSDYAAKDMFKAYVEREDNSSISVSEVKLAFPGGACLLEALDKILAAPPSKALDDTFHEPASIEAGSRSIHQKLAPCLLPQPDALYTGKEEMK